MRQALQEKIQLIETEQQRHITQKEKYALKEEIKHTLLPRAFSKLSRVYAYIDLQYNYLVIDTTQEKKLETFLSWLRRAVSGIEIKRPDIHSPTAMLTS